jgi:hypothetical protein
LRSTKSLHSKEANSEIAAAMTRNKAELQLGVVNGKSDKNSKWLVVKAKTAKAKFNAITGQERRQEAQQEHRTWR